MSKKLVLLIVFLTSSCGWLFGSDEFYLCPMVSIPRESSYLIQKYDNIDSFRIEITGFDGFCFYDDRTKSNRAAVTPIFKITRLRPSDEADIHFSYFIETAEGPVEFLGKQTFHTKVTLPTDSQYLHFKARQTQVRLPLEENAKIDIRMGLVMSRSEKNYNKTIFDIDYKYE